MNHEQYAKRIERIEAIKKYNPELFNENEKTSAEIQERYEQLRNDLQNEFFKVAQAYGEALLKLEKQQGIIDAALGWHKLKLHEHPPGMEAPVPVEWINTVGERCRALDKAIEEYLHP